MSAVVGEVPVSWAGGRPGLGKNNEEEGIDRRGGIMYYVIHDAE